MICKKSFLRPKPIKEHPDRPRADQNWFAFLEEIRKYPVLTKEEEGILVAKALTGDLAARQKLCNHNLRMVITVAMKYQGMGLTPLEMVNEGAAGLMRATARFQPGRNVRFMSYAIWWVRQGIIRALHEQARTIRLSAEHEQALARVKHNPVSQVIGGDWVVDLGEERVNHQNLRQSLLSASVASLNALNGTHGAADSRNPLTLMEMLPADTESPEQGVEDEEQRRRIQHHLSILDPKTREIIRLHFGLNGGPGIDLAALGIRMNLSRERIRQLKEAGLKKMRRFAKR